MTLTHEAAGAAIFLPKIWSEPYSSTLAEYVDHSINGQIEDLMTCSTIAEEHAALNAIILLCGKPFIGDIRYMKFYDSGAHHRSAAIFSNFGFPHTLRDDMLTSLQLNVHPPMGLQFIFDAKNNQTNVYDSSTVSHDSYPMDMSIKVAGICFESLRTAVGDALCSKLVQTTKGMMVQS